MLWIPDKNLIQNVARCDFKYPEKRTFYSPQTFVIPQFENHCFFRLRLCRFFPFWEVVSRSASLWLFRPDCVLYWPYFAFIELHTCQWSSHFKLQHHSKYLSILWTVLSIRYVALYHCKKMFWFYILARPFAKTTASWKKNNASLCNLFIKNFKQLWFSFRFPQRLQLSVCYLWLYSLSGYVVFWSFIFNW